MKIIQTAIVQNTQNYTDTNDYRLVREMIYKAIQNMQNPAGSGTFLLRARTPGVKKQAGHTVNGVNPIKTGFMEYLHTVAGWEFEERVTPTLGACDAVFHFPSGRKPFIVEWETGNISSTPRATNRILTAILRNDASGGVVILPSAKMYAHITDRIGNFHEMEPYIDLYRRLDSLSTEPYFFGYVEIEQDGLSNSIDYLPGKIDGLAQISRQP
jgi:type-2 restriction enzyme bamHI